MVENQVGRVSFRKITKKNRKILALFLSLTLFASLSISECLETDYSNPLSLVVQGLKPYSKQTRVKFSGFFFFFNFLLMIRCV